MLGYLRIAASGGEGRVVLVDCEAGVPCVTLCFIQSVETCKVLLY